MLNSKFLVSILVAFLLLIPSGYGYTQDFLDDDADNSIPAVELETLISSAFMADMTKVRSAEIERQFNKDLTEPMHVKVVDLFENSIVLRFVFDPNVLTVDDIFSFIKERTDNLLVVSSMSQEGILYVSLTPIEEVLTRF